MSDIIKREIPTDFVAASSEGRMKNKGIKRSVSDNQRFHSHAILAHQEASIASIVNAKFLICKGSLITAEGMQTNMCVCVCMCEREGRRNGVAGFNMYDVLGAL